MDEQQQMTPQKKIKGKGGLFIPAGLFLGFGAGFLVDNITAGMFLGLGAGFAAFGISLFFEK